MHGALPAGGRNAALRLNGRGRRKRVFSRMMAAIFICALLGGCAPKAERYEEALDSLRQGWCGDAKKTLLGLGDYESARDYAAVLTLCEDDEFLAAARMAAGLMEGDLTYADWDAAFYEYLHDLETSEDAEDRLLAEACYAALANRRTGISDPAAEVFLTGDGVGALSDLLARCGAEADGKLLLLAADAEGADCEILFGTMASLPADAWPAAFTEVEYVVLLQYGAAGASAGAAVAGREAEAQGTAQNGNAADANGEETGLATVRVLRCPGLTTIWGPLTTARSDFSDAAAYEAALAENVANAAAWTLMQGE